MMDVIIPIVGIPHSSWKNTLVRHARKNPHIIMIHSKDSCYECSRHLEILNMFDSGEIRYKKSEYYKFQRKRNKKGNSSILRSINRFKKLYEDIKKKGCKVPPIITVDGCRLDGSHRCAILAHLGVSKIKVNVVQYDHVFKKERTKQKIRSFVQHYRKAKYDL